MDRSVCRMHTQLLRNLQRSRKRSLSSTNSLGTLSLLLLVLLSHSPSLSLAQCTSTAGCFPSLGSLALGRTVLTDSQCTDGDSFCLPETTDCSNNCRSSSHSVDSINDGNNGTAWISSIGSSSSSVTLQLDFQEPVLFVEMVLLWKSSRPRAMVLEKSRNRGDTWEVYRYYSTSCLSDFGLTPMETYPSVQFFSTVAICTASQSTLFPSTNAEVNLYSLERVRG